MCQYANVPMKEDIKTSKVAIIMNEPDLKKASINNLNKSS